MFDNYILSIYFTIVAVLVSVIGLFLYNIIKYRGQTNLEISRDHSNIKKFKILIAIFVVPSIFILGMLLGGGYLYLTEDYSNRYPEFMEMEFEEHYEDDEDDEDMDDVVLQDNDRKNKEKSDQNRQQKENIQISGSVNNGKKIFSTKGCAACHRIEGEVLVGPSFHKLYGSTRKFVDGTTMVANEKYIKESIVTPAKQVVEGFATVPMIQFQLTDQEVNDLVIYIRSLVTKEKDSQGSDVGEKQDSLSALIKEGEQLYKTKGCAACHRIEGEALIGPNFSKLFGSTRKFTDGSSLVADENYIEESIRSPDKKIIEGFTTVPMIQFQLTDQEVKSLIQYIKSLK